MNNSENCQRAKIIYSDAKAIKKAILSLLILAFVVSSKLCGCFNHIERAYFTS